MRPTRQYWTTAAIGATLAGLAVLLARPLLLVGATGIGAWLVARQLSFLRELRRTDDALTINITLTPEQIATGDRTTLSVTAAMDADPRLDLSVTPSLPIPLAHDDTDLTLTPTHGQTTRTTTVTSETAGAFTINPPTLTASDGLLTDSLERGPERVLTIEPNTPGNIHIGEGGDELGTLYEQGGSQRADTGLDLAGVREYVPGDTAHRIDWNATARLNEPHVQEFERSTDWTTVLVVDHRGDMADGTPGETKLDYGRNVALALTNAARERDEPLGLYTVGGNGTTGAWRPRSTAGHYETLRHRLQALTVDTDANASPSAGRTPASARQVADRLRSDGGQFAGRIRPFFESSQSYVERIEDKPLFNTLRLNLPSIQGSVRTIIIADDTNRTELVESVRLAHRDGNSVLVFLTPNSLFEPGGLSDLEAAYERFIDFEEFRRDLSAHDQVAAFEVAPDDRIGAVLTRLRDAQHSGSEGGYQ